MVDQVIQNTFLETYRDDFSDSAGFHRILFNNGRAVQARELTQLQTITQRELTRIADNLFVEGAIVQGGGFSSRSSQFAKLNETTNALPSNTSTLINTTFTGATSGVSGVVTYIEPSGNGDPGTIYVRYTNVSASDVRFRPGENISNGSTTLTIQTTNTTSNPALGEGVFLSNNSGIYFVSGRMVFTEAQTILAKKYENFTTNRDNFGFKVVESIVTANDDESLYDNSGPLPNTSSPGADRYKIALQLTLESDVDPSENFVKAGLLNGVQIYDVKRPADEENYDIIRDLLAKRTSEESGDYIVKPFKVTYRDNATDTSKLDVILQPGVAYVDGYRVELNTQHRMTVNKPRSTTTTNNEVTAFTLGNYVLVNGTTSKGLPDIHDFSQINLYNTIGGTGTVIGTARVRAIDEDNTAGYYRIHLFQISMNSGQNFRSVRSLGTGTLDYMNLVLELGQAVLKDPKVNSLLLPLPKIRPANIDDIALTTQRRFTAAVTAGSASLNLSASGETFANTNDWIICDDGNDVFTGATITGVGTTSATISGLGAASSIEVMTYVDKSAGAIRSKTLNTGQEDTIIPGAWDSDGNGTIFAYLSKSDVYNFTSVTKDTVGGNSVRSRFILDNGQRDNYYGLGRLVLKSGQTVPTYDVVAKYDYFSHGVSGDFFAVNSYSGQVDYEDIPTHTLANGTSIPLRNVLDFRPVVNSSGTFASGAIINELPQPNDTIRADVEYYNARNDKVIINTNSVVSVVKGEESLTPFFPNHPDNSMELYRIQHNPYVLNSSDLKSIQIDHKHYTMGDIGRLENRLNSLEEVTSLTLLELDTANLAVLDSDGNNRTKSGFFVDTFTNHFFSDVSDPDYNAAIDPVEKYMRPRGNTDAINLMYDSDNVLNSNVVKRGDNIYLKYTHRSYINQNMASDTENVLPFWQTRFNGNITLSPASDNWIEKSYQPDSVVTQTQLDTSGANLWNDHEWNWGGTPIDQLSVGSTTNTITLSSSSGSSTSVRETTGDYGFGGTETVRTSWTSTQTGLNRVVGETTIREVVGDRLLQTATIPFMRSRKIYFQGRGFRPDTEVFPFFDKVDVSDWCRSETFVRTSDDPQTVGNVNNTALGHPEGSSPLIADANGDIEGSFFIPSTANLRFNAGTRIFTLIDATDPNNVEFSTSYGIQKFTSQGVLETRQKDVLSTRILEIATSTSTSETSSSRVTNTTSVSGTSIDTDNGVGTNDTVIPTPRAPTGEWIAESTDPANWWRNTVTGEVAFVNPVPGPACMGEGNDDPLAQSFRVSEQNGVFATKVDIYFAAKDPGTAPVWGQIRAMNNGFPSPEIIGGSTVFKFPTDITTSTDASVATTFEFDEPVYLAPGKEYCFVLISSVPTYKVYISRVGDFELGTTDRKIVKQPFLGSLFKSQNNSTWTPVQWEDLKMQIHVAKFSNTQGVATLTNTNVPQKLLTEDPMSVDSADATITVYQPSHGFTVGDTVNISGAIDLAGISASSINGARTITVVDATGYQFEADSASTSAEIGGGSAILADQNILMDIANINLSTLIPPAAQIVPSIATTSGQSIAGTETAYQLSTTYRGVSLGKNIVFDNPRMIANADNETAYLSGNKSFNLKLSMKTFDQNVSPVVDMQRATVIAVNNIIDKPSETPAAGFNVPINYVSETNPKGGSSVAKHISKVITLAQDAVGMKLFVTANKPNDASFDVYYRVASGDDNIADISWTAVSPSSGLISDENPEIFREYEYLIGGNTGTLDAFNQMQIKIVMVSQNQAKVPTFKDIRTIALAV
jgi:hypothetical protein